MNEKLKERIERLVEERYAIQSKIDNVNSELNRLFPLKNELVDILSKKQECLKALLDATLRELRYVIASEADEIKMAELDCVDETSPFTMGGVHFTDKYGLKYTLGLESVHAKKIMNECEHGAHIGFVYDRHNYVPYEIIGSHLSFDNMSKVGFEGKDELIRLYRVEGKLFSELKIGDREGNCVCVMFAPSRTDYSHIKLVLRDEDDRVLWAIEVPDLERNN